MTEVNRLLRHIIPPAVFYAVGKGWIPEELQQPLIEALLAASTVGVAFMASRASDKRQ